MQSSVTNNSKLLDGKQCGEISQIDQIQTEAQADEDALREQTAIRDKGQESIDYLQAKIRRRQDLFNKLPSIISNRATESKLKARTVILQQTGKKKKKKSKKSLGPSHPDRKIVHQACWKCQIRHRKVRKVSLFTDLISQY